MQGVSQPVDGAVTTRFRTQGVVFVFPEQSLTVTVIGYVPGPTIEPAAGDWEQVGIQQLSLKQFVNWQRSGTMTLQPVGASNSCAEDWRQAQSMVGGVVSGL